MFGAKRIRFLRDFGEIHHSQHEQGSRYQGSTIKDLSRSTLNTQHNSDNTGQHTQLTSSTVVRLLVRYYARAAKANAPPPITSETEPPFSARRAHSESVGNPHEGGRNAVSRGHALMQTSGFLNQSQKTAWKKSCSFSPPDVDCKHCVRKPPPVLFHLRALSCSSCFTAHSPHPINHLDSSCQPRCTPKPFLTSTHPSIKAVRS